MFALGVRRPGMGTCDEILGGFAVLLGECFVPMSFSQN